MTRKPRTPTLEDNEELKKPLPEDCFLDLKRLSQRTCMSVRSLRGHINNPSHPLPIYRVRGKILVSWLEFKRWIQRYRYRTQDIDEIVDEVMESLRKKK